MAEAKSRGLGYQKMGNGAQVEVDDVVIMGSDGVFDNLFLHEIVSLVCSVLLLSGVATDYSIRGCLRIIIKEFQMPLNVSRRSRIHLEIPSFDAAFSSGVREAFCFQTVSDWCASSH